MSEFVPFNQPKGFSLIIGYHPPSGKRFGFRFTANSGLELIRFSKQKSGWSHFVVFPAIDGNMSPRFMLYNRGNGKAHIGEILSSYQMSFSCESNLNAGYSHVVSIGSFIFCYSQTEDTVTILSLQGNKMIPKQLPALLGNPVGGNLFIIPISESTLFVYHQSSGTK
jgi:hypothetical protein